jgi:hypothetical protein
MTTPTHGPAHGITATIIHEEWMKQWTPTLEDAERTADRVLWFLNDRGALCTDPWEQVESVPCPKCGVDRTRPCRTHAGHILPVPHWQRHRAWERTLDTRENRIRDLARDLSRTVGLAGLAAREANQ